MLEAVGHLLGDATRSLKRCGQVSRGESVGQVGWQERQKVVGTLERNGVDDVDESPLQDRPTLATPGTTGSVDPVLVLLGQNHFDLE